MRLPMRIPGASESAEYTEKRSRFISRCWNVRNRDEVKGILSGLKTEHPAASHIVYAFVLGDENSEELGMSDDGEPKGTSGRPTLEVLKGSGLRNSLVTTVRYFGGTKLGTGGLVRAYTEAAKAAIEATEAVLARELITVSCAVAYGEYEVLKRFLAGIYCEIICERFETDVALELRIEQADLAALQTALKDMSRGVATVTVLEEP
jgi:uncharacterized YigZ family protein